MSGFAALNGEPDGPPLLPPLALADGVAALATAFAIMVALRARDETGRGQVVDTSLVEPLLTLLGPQVTAYDLLGTLQARTGNRSSHNAPRNVYRTADDAWVAVSASATSIAERVLRLVGRDDLVAQPWFATGAGRVAHVEEIDAAVAGWIAARPRDEVLAAFEAAEAAIAPVYDASDLLADPQLAAIGAFVVDRRRRARTDQDDEHDQPPLRDAGRDRAHGRARTAPTPRRCSPRSGSTRRSSSACVRRESCERAAAHLAVRPRRPARPRREGDRVARARRDRRPRGRRRAGREGGGARERLPELLGERREKPVFVRINAGSDADLEAVARLAIDGVDRAEGRARPSDVPAGVDVHALIETRARPRVRVRDRVAPRRAGHLARRGATCARRRARSRRVSTGRGAGSSMRPSRRGCRGRRSRSTRTCATSKGSPRRAVAAASSAISAARRSTPTSCR